MNKTFIFFRVLLVCFLLHSCGNSNSEQIEHISYKVLEGELEVSHGELLLSRAGFKRITAKDSLLVFDYSSSQFVIFDMAKRKPVWSLEMTREGPDFLESPVYDAWVDNAKLYVLSKSYFSAYNIDSGKIEYRLSSDEITGWNEDFRIQSFVIKSDTIIFSKKSMAVSVPGHIDKPTNSILYVYSLKDNRLDSLKVNYPEESMAYNYEAGYYNHLAEHKILLDGDILFYNFLFSSAIYSIDIKTQKTKRYSGESEYSPALREPRTPQELRTSDVQYIYSGPKYFRLLSLDDLNLFVRKHTDYEKTSDGRDLQHCYLTFFNEQMEVVYEMEVEPLIYGDPIILGNKVVFLKRDQLNENSFQFVSFELVEK